jgi:hypothetical protein
MSGGRAVRSECRRRRRRPAESAAMALWSAACCRRAALRAASTSWSGSAAGSGCGRHQHPGQAARRVVAAGLAAGCIDIVVSGGQLRPCCRSFHGGQSTLLGFDVRYMVSAHSFLVHFFSYSELARMIPVPQTLQCMQKRIVNRTPRPLSSASQRARSKA